ncbi:uncharacterized protein LOC110847404 [Folsomia candida]|uniref:uncharacterized protein LOC110847404 n=1 Tax=Folsomia candida TaxID=158441 RepID=UPI000B8F8AB3|nr:uncharacterized protein LOC110847404 [Folsomia candida]
MFPVSRYKPISNSQVIILSLNFLFFFTTTSGQQRGLDGSQNVQLPRRAPILDYKPQGQDIIPVLPSSPSGIGTGGVYRSFIQFDRTLEPLQNDPSSPNAREEQNDCWVDDGTVEKFKLRLRQRLQQNREYMEAVIDLKFNQLENRFISIQENSLLAEKILLLNETVTNLEDSNLIVEFKTTMSIDNNLVEDRMDNNNRSQEDNALLHFFSVVNSLDLPKTWSWPSLSSVHPWIERLLEYNTFVSSNPEFNLITIHDISNDTAEIPKNLITSSECGGAAITMTEGTFSFQPNDNSDNFTLSGGTCIWRIAPTNSQSVAIRFEQDSFLRKHRDANVSLVPSDVWTWSPIQYGKNYDRNTIKKNCDWEWNCHSYNDGPSSTFLKTDRVVRILNESSKLKRLFHHDREQYKFDEKNVYIILNFDPSKGTPPAFSLQFKGRSCMFCYGAEHDIKPKTQMHGKLDNDIYEIMDIYVTMFGVVSIFQDSINWMGERLLQFL